MDLTGDLAAIAAPTLVIGGAEDRATPPASTPRGSPRPSPARGWRSSSGAAHMANVERPDAVTDLIREHLGR